MEEKYEKNTNRNFNPITSFLDKFKKILGDSGAQKDSLIKILKEEIGIELEKDKITISKSIASISASPILKNEILMRKQKILTKLKDSGLNISDIK